MIGVAAALAAVGLIVFLAGGALVRSLGTPWRVGRILAAARDVPLAQLGAEASRGGTDGPGRYVRTHGRISSDEEFPDESDRPLVFRRTRLQRAGRRSGEWRTLGEQRLAVPFSIEERGAVADVDVDALGDGLVVVPRIAVGIAAEMPTQLAAMAREALPADIPVRVRIDQVSAVEHATVAGVVTLGPSGTPRLTAGLGRPLVLTTVEPGAAMRLLGAESRGRVVTAAVMLVSGLGVLAIAVVLALLTLFASPVSAASPLPEPAPSRPAIGTRDPRSNGQAPGLEGSPLTIAAGVVLRGLQAAGGTLVYLRVTRDE